LSDKRVAAKYKWSKPFISRTQVLLVQTLGRVVALSGTREGVIYLDVGSCRHISATDSYWTVMTTLLYAAIVSVQLFWLKWQITTK